MSRTYDEIIADLKFQIARRGGINGISRCFQVNDSNKNGLFENEEFELVLSRAGIFLKKQEMNALFKKFDKDKSGKLDYSEFLRGLQGNLSGRRLNIALLAFQKLDKDGSGIVDRDDLKGTFDCSRHPKVISGEMSEEQVFKQFLASFEGTQKDGKVTKEEFLDYMANLSSNFPFSDDKFVQTVESAWKVTEDESKVNAVDPKLLASLKKDIIEKARQRTKGAKYEKDTLIAAFKHFDIDDSGKLIYQEFKKGLETIGVQPNDTICQALFNSFDKSGNGSLTYREFSDALFGDGTDFNKSFLSKMGGAERKACVIFVLGGPGTGKGTQCAKIVEEFGFEHLCAGDLLRAERKREGSKYGEMINNIIKEGKLVPSDITTGLLKNAVDEAMKCGNKYFLIDGFPRSLGNLNSYEKIFGKSATVASTFYFNCSEDTMVQRLLGRAETSGRADDNINTIKKRLQTFKDQTGPVLKVLRALGRFDDIDARESPEKVYAKVKPIVKDIMQKY
mmetsp:Transcript_26234/g.36534  ORF Transcript_26234/g.36534 Transcript_26234/m.36534 type:complete len:506 (-) Transcript_26234:273-1790(-)|eukprot:CAMPEP_0184490866 /NCGR_PEP_ID=MMETSP0113_2-20130426/19115_1 /TAXON_ID=91329 /ORGANISM="Norrisiella sphaerica, Strain BC52" /LENGTH=505 /DNA_ID=CAMNT_0026874985 /DNA_START=65 /DNA_END=1582 /DNA_ORIENTATION=-